MYVLEILLDQFNIFFLSFIHKNMSLKGDKHAPVLLNNQIVKLLDSFYTVHVEDADNCIYALQFTPMED